MEALAQIEFKKNYFWGLSGAWVTYIWVFGVIFWVAFEVFAPTGKPKICRPPFPKKNFLQRPMVISTTFHSYKKLVW